MKRNLVALCVLACFCAFTTGAYAQPAPAEEPVINTNVPPDYEITVTSGSVMSAEVDGISTDVQVSKLNIDVEAPGVEFGYGLRHFEWDNANNLPGITDTDPFSDLHKIYLALQDTRIVYEEQWGYTARLEIASSFEKEMGNSFSYEAMLGGVYEYDENLMIVAGAMLHWDETDYWVIPTGRVQYRKFADEGLSVVVGIPETYAAYKFDNGIGVKAGWAIENEVYKLGRRNDYGPQGFIETWEQIISLESSFQLSENVRLQGGLTWNVDREYTRYTEGGNRVYKMDIDKAVGMTGGVYVSF